MKKSRLHYVKINSLTLFLKEIVALLCAFILPKVILSYFGSEYNGLISSITQFLAVVAIFRLGIANAARFSFYKPLANNDVNELSTTVNSYQNYMKKSGIFAAIYIVALSVIYPLFLGKEFSFVEVFVLIIGLGAMTFSQYIFGITYSCVLEADQKSFIIHILEAITNINVTVASCVLIFVHLELPYVKLVASAIWIIQPIFIYFFVNKYYKIDKKARIDKTKLSRKNDAMVHSVANIVHENTDIWTLTILSTKSLISVYSIYNLVLVGLKQVVSVFVGSLEAPFGNMFAKKEKDIIEQNLHLHEFASFSVTTLLYSCAFVLIVPFVRLYTSTITDFNYNVPIYAAFAVGAGITFCLRSPYQTVVQAGGYYKETKVFAIIEAILNVLITVSLVPFLGLIGAAVGTIVANLFRTITYSWFVYRKILNKSMVHFYSKLVVAILNCFMIIAISFRACSSFAIMNWWYWIACGFGTVSISFVVLIASSSIFYPNELKRFLNKLFPKWRKAQ